MNGRWLPAHAGALLFLAASMLGACAAPHRDPAAHAHEFASGAVAADHALASRAGEDMLRRGGNAVDAAVAAAFCLSVVRPSACGIGGGGFMVIYLPADPRHGSVCTALDYRERAPRGVGPDHFVSLPPAASRRGGNAVAVPGTVAGLLHALERFGTLERAVVLQPAIRAAREGFVLDEHEAGAVSGLQQDMAVRRNPADLAAAELVQDLVGGTGRPRAGQPVRLPGQARALELIARDGAAAFYDGEIGPAIARAVQAFGGVLDMQDLGGVRVLEPQPLSAEIFGRRWLCMPPPSSGGLALLQILSILQGTRQQWSTQAPDSAAYLHALAEALKHAFADRAAWLGDPEFVDVPTDRLLSADRLQQAVAAYDPQHTRPAEQYGLSGPPAIDGGTSHVCAVDPWGGAVACTETINTAFGSQVAVPGFGFFLNNQMDDFTTRRGQANAYRLQQSDRNLPAPGKRPLSSMCPVIVLDSAGRVEAVAGASGGPRIISATAQVLLNALCFDMPAGQAVAAPRIHHQWMPEVLYIEKDASRAVSWRAAMGLAGKGHRLQRTPDGGIAQLIIRRGQRWQAASDPRLDGAPAGF
jgi:gamma-glutamyltranspeptidase/glutathione hydrolase